jgi:hypothetical protein
MSRLFAHDIFRQLDTDLFATISTIFRKRHVLTNLQNTLTQNSNAQKIENPNQNLILYILV